jgi:hypothetical protein
MLVCDSFRCKLGYGEGNLPSVKGFRSKYFACLSEMQKLYTVNGWIERYVIVLHAVTFV